MAFCHSIYIFRRPHFKAKLFHMWDSYGDSLVFQCLEIYLNLLYIFVGLILVSEPYFNEAGYEKQRGTQHGQENSRMYNEMAILKLVQVSRHSTKKHNCIFLLAC